MSRRNCPGSSLEYMQMVVINRRYLKVFNGFVPGIPRGTRSPSRSNDTRRGFSIIPNCKPNRACSLCIPKISPLPRSTGSELFLAHVFSNRERGRNYESTLTGARCVSAPDCSALYFARSRFFVAALIKVAYCRARQSE